MKYIKPNNRIIKKIIVFSLLILLSTPILTNAAPLVPCGGENDPCTTCDLLILAQNVLEFALKMAFLVIIGFIVYGGFRWIFSLGKEEHLKAGQQIITNAIIGLIIILTAWIIVNTVFWTIKQMGGDDYTGTWFHIECPESGSILDMSGDGTTPSENIVSNDEENENEEEEWEDAVQYTISDSNQMCLPITISRECADGFNLNKSKCETGEHTITTESKMTSNGKGWYCKFVGDTNIAGSDINPCYPPIGTLYIDCIIDPDYIPLEEQIEQKKKEMEEKYADLDGEWVEYPIMCPEWDKNCDEASGAAECGVIQKKIKDGFCLAIEPTKLLNSPGEIYGNGWHCDFGKNNINSPSPEGKSFAYCISEDNGTPANIVEPEPESDPEPESKCVDCGIGWSNICDEDECLALGNCKFTNTFGPGGKCEFNNN